MKFASSYEPGEFEADIYAAWESSGAFKPIMPTVSVDDDNDGVDDRVEGQRGDVALDEMDHAEGLRGS